MIQFFKVQPGALWSGILVGLMLLAAWAQEYFGSVAWIPPVVALVLTVIVPVMKVLIPPPDAELAAGSDGALSARGLPQERSAFMRWLL